MPLPGKNSFTVSYDALDDISSKIKDKFYWSRMHYPKETVSLALFFMVFCSLDASLTAFILSNVLVYLLLTIASTVGLERAR